MGRLTKAKRDEIARLRGQNYTQKETAEKVGVHLRTVRKYDPLREQGPSRPTVDQLKENEEACSELAAEGLVRKESDGRFRITSLGKRTYKKLEELEEKAILEFMAEADRPVSEEEIDRYLDEIGDELFDEALNEVKRRRG